MTANVGLHMNAMTSTSRIPMPTGILQRKCDCGQHTIAGGGCSACSKERELPLQRSAINPPASHIPGAAPAVVNEVLRSQGQPLNATTRTFFEPRLGHDFSRVRVHTSERMPVARLGSGPRTLSSKPMSRREQPSPELERPVISNESTGLPMDAGSPSPAPVGCIPPKSVTMGSVQAIEFPDYFTGGGICAVMQVDPTASNLCAGITEEITSAPKATCPDSLIKGGLCQGSSTFTLGTAQGGACSSIKPKPTEFVDRHSIQLSSTSLLHDSERNPKGLKACQFTCNQQYYIQTGAARVTLGQFQIQYELSEGTRDGKKITKVTTTKTAKK